MPTIRRDEQGLYVHAGGYVARPVPDAFSHEGHLLTMDQSEMGNVRIDNQSRYHEGQKVYARHIGGSRRVRVGKKPNQEIWFTHDTYI